MTLLDQAKTISSRTNPGHKPATRNKWRELYKDKPKEVTALVVAWLNGDVTTKQVAGVFIDKPGTTQYVGITLYAIAGAIKQAKSDGLIEITASND